MSCYCRSRRLLACSVVLAYLHLGSAKRLHRKSADATYEEEDGIDDDVINVHEEHSMDAYELVQTDEFAESNSSAYPQPSGRSCPYEKLTQVCSEIGGGSTYDDLSSCPSKVVTVSKGWVCKEQSERPRCGWDPEKQDPGFITRQEILDRAVVWIEHGIRYSQRRYHKEASRGNKEMAYRTDCSGYVSMAWKAEVAPSTWHFAGQTASKLFQRVACNLLLPGDALVTAGKGHIVLFREWLSQKSGSYTAWEEEGHATGTVAKTRSFSKDMTKSYGPNDSHRMTGSSKNYLCLRRKNIVGEGVPTPAPSPTTDPNVGASCKSIPGTCIDTSQSACHTATKTGLCPGPSNIKCCPTACRGGVAGQCIDVQTSSCGKSTLTGLCPGASNIRCCPE